MLLSHKQEKRFLETFEPPPTQDFFYDLYEKIVPQIFFDGCGHCSLKFRITPNKKIRCNIVSLNALCEILIWVISILLSIRTQVLVDKTNKFFIKASYIVEITKLNIELE